MDTDHFAHIHTPRGCLPSQSPNIALAAAEPFNLTSFALSLLLVFRTNSSYARWLEARTLWGSLVNRCRNLIRQVLMFIPPEEMALRAALVRWTIAFPKSLKVHLREDKDITRVLQHILHPDELTVVAGSKHAPLAILQALSQLTQSAGLDSMSTSRLDINVEVMEDILGACERILRTPIPLSYTRYVIPCSGVLAFLLLGIDEIAIQLEEPFGILPLEAICETIKRNLEDLTSSEQSVQQVVDMASTHRPQAQATDASTASVPDFSNTRESVQEDTATSGPSYSWHSHTLDGNDVGHGWQVNSIPIREKSIDDYA
eukprot:jgi/Chrzof1/518/Cz01g18220.t1